MQVTCHRSRLWHSGAVAERTREVIDRHLGIAQVNTADATTQQTVFVRIAGDIVQTSIDSSGELLHRRGHRTSIGEAPLRETLAAAMVRMLNQERKNEELVLWDPFCGSGCLSIEWVERQLGLDAGRDRRFAFETWPIHDSTSYHNWVESREPAASRLVCAFGSDIDEAVLDAARANAGRSKVDSHCIWLQGDFEAISDTVPLGAAILTNPPYGIRSGNLSNFANVLGRFEVLLSRRADLRPVIALLPESLRPWQPNLHWQCLARFHNGGLRVQALRLD
jgi:putative N6-adenine-specific DNA methylase